ncbi:hypothetical protein [Dyella sp. S184]|uniref:hypothetical protein n=1 Tax=Dyella sp. S184 TaxID=1641862 RepID=UPI00131BC3D7|nr:hypothetical protein [Dyella sp. S184]
MTKLIHAPAVKSIVFTALLLSQLSACSSPHLKREPGNSDYPVLDSFAAHYLVLSGMIAPAINISMSVRWVAKTSACAANINWVEGVDAPFYADMPINLVRSGKRYTARVPLDGVVPGRCGWSFGTVIVSGVDNQGRKVELAENSEDENSLIAVTRQPLTKKDVGAVRNLICVPQTGSIDPVRASTLRCGEKLDTRGEPFLSKLWVNPSTQHAEVNFYF